jgi:hypothetical protein
LVREGEFAYRVPNFAAYRAIRNEEERREYNRIKKAEQREREKAQVKADVNDSQTLSNRASASVSASGSGSGVVVERKKNETKEGDLFHAVWQAYPKRAGGNPRAAAVRAYAARLREGVDEEHLLAGTRRYAAFIRATGKEGTEYVKQGATFFGPDRHWEEPWDAPASPAERKAASTTSMLQEWVNG